MAICRPITITRLGASVTELEKLQLDDEPTVEVLPPGFPLPALLKFVPNPQVKVALDDATSQLLRVQVQGREGIQAAAEAMAQVRVYLDRTTRDFEEPKRLAYQLHSHITKLLADQTDAAQAALKAVGQAIWAETRRLDLRDAEVRRKDQQIADQLERDRITREAEAAAEANAPRPVVEALKAQAQTAMAPPVPVQAAEPPADVVTVTTWKARVQDTPPDAINPNPAMADLSLAQRARVLELLADIVETRRNLTAVEINWKVLNARAKAERSAFSVPGFEAFESGGTRAKPGKRIPSS